MEEHFLDKVIFNLIVARLNREREGIDYAAPSKNGITGKYKGYGSLKESADASIVTGQASRSDFRIKF